MQVKKWEIILLAIIYTGGTFDLFHSGHINLLSRCREIAGLDGKVIVSLNTDEFILKYKGKAPIMNQNERRQVLLSCKFVDEVIINVGNEDSTIAIEEARPNYIVVGSDWAMKNYYQQMNFSQEWLDERKIGLVYVPYTRDISSTNIKKRFE